LGVPGPAPSVQRLPVVGQVAEPVEVRDAKPVLLEVSAAPGGEAQPHLQGDEEYARFRSSG